MKKNKGFTLIELLVVIAIIGILSSVVLASLNSARQKARDAKRISDIKQLQLALELYFDSNNAYPATLSLLTSTFIAAVPLDPITAAEYQYAALGSGLGAPCTSYHLSATLEQEAHTAFDSDSDADAGTACTATADFTAVDGDADQFYDVTP